MIIRLTLLDSNFPGNPLWAWESHPLELTLPVSKAMAMQFVDAKILLLGSGTVKLSPGAGLCEEM